MWGVGGAGVHAHEDVGDDDPVGLVGIERAGPGEDLVVAFLGRVGDQVVVEARAGDHRRGAGRSGDDHLVVVAEQSLGEGKQGAEVAGPCRVLIKTRIAGQDVLAGGHSLTRPLWRM